MENIELIPTGGLCNRMRAIATSISIAQRYHANLKIYWNNTIGLKADFSELFEPFQIPHIEVHENKKWLYRINGRKDYLLKSAYFHFRGKVFFNYSLYREGNNIFPLTDKVRQKRLILITCYPMCEQNNMKNLFVPVPKIRKEIELVTSKFNEDTIGIHIRRTDNKTSIINSPVSKFIELMKKEVAANPNTTFYLATDDHSVKQEITALFGNRIFIQNEDADRNSIRGMVFSVVELFCLSKTRKIYGSYASSYSQTAAILGGSEYIQVTKDL